MSEVEAARGNGVVITQSKPMDTVDLPKQVHRGKGLVVGTQIATGINPSISITWAVDPLYIKSGYTLLAFRSNAGFSANQYPEDLAAHGTLFIETFENGCHTDLLPEGTYYYTFLLRRTRLFGLFEQVGMVRFAETIPTAKIGIGRIKDQLELRDLSHNHELNGIEHEMKMNNAERLLIRSKQALDRMKGTAGSEPTDPGLASELADADTILETHIVRRDTIDRLKKNPKFQSLSPEEQEDITNQVKAKLDPGEISARREMESE